MNRQNGSILKRINAKTVQCEHSLSEKKSPADFRSILPILLGGEELPGSLLPGRLRLVPESATKFSFAIRTYPKMVIRLTYHA